MLLREREGEALWWAGAKREEGIAFADCGDGKGLSEDHFGVGACSGGLLHWSRVGRGCSVGRSGIGGRVRGAM